MSRYSLFSSFLATYHAKSLREAAGQCGVSQPALSRHIKQLEEDLGQRLFERGPRGATPTDFARTLVTQIEPAMDDLQRVWQLHDRQHSTGPGSVYVGGHPGVLSSLVMPQIVPLLSQGIAVHFVSGGLSQLVSDFNARAVDILISNAAYDTGLDIAGMKQQIFYQGAHVLVGSAAQADTLDSKALAAGDLEVLNNADWVGYGEMLRFATEYMKTVFGETENFKPNVVMTVPNIFGMLTALIEGVGIGVLPDFFCREALESGQLVKLYSPETHGKPVPEHQLHITYPNDAGSEDEKSTVSAPVKQVINCLLSK